MKRLVISMALLVLCVGVSAYSRLRVSEVNDKIVYEVNSVFTAISEEDPIALARHIDTLSAYWDDEEDHLSHIIRHAQIDELTKSIARLKALAAGADYTELTAELDTILWQVEHICRGERLLPSNLL